MIKNILLIVALLLLVGNISMAQKLSRKYSLFKAEVGIDVFPSLAYLSNSEKSEQKIALLFRSNFKNNSIRFRVMRQTDRSRSNSIPLNYFEYVDSSFPDVIGIKNTWSSVKYTHSILTGYTYTKNLGSENKTSIYFGADVGMNFDYGYNLPLFLYNSSATQKQGFPFILNKSAVKTVLLHPLFGVKHRVSDRVSFSLELIYPFEYTYGTIPQYVAFGKEEEFPSPFNGWKKYSSWYNRFRLSAIYLTYSFGKIKK